MAYEVEVSDEFRDWYEPLSEAEQLSIDRVIGLLEEKGTALGFPYYRQTKDSTGDRVDRKRCITPEADFAEI